MNPTVSVIMPAYNEGWCIFENIRMTRLILAEAGISAEIVAVDDGSTDNTLTEIERAAEEFDTVVATRNPYNIGKGMALRTGFEHSSGDIVVFLDADLDLHPSQITTLIGVLESGPCDIVVGSKHHPDSKLDYPPFRKVASWVYYMLIKTLFGLPVRDTQTGLKVFRRNVLDDAFHRLLVKKFAYDVELLAVAVRLGHRVREVPVAIDFKRALKWGRIRFSDVMSLFVDTLAIFYRLRILRYYDPKRPPVSRERRNVLVVVNGGTPPEDVVRRLTFDCAHTVRIVCLAEDADLSGVSGDIPVFHLEKDLADWLAGEGRDVEIIGFLHPDYLPLGSWVKSAVRNFEDSEVDAVTGPCIPGPFSRDSERVAGMVFSSALTRGTDTYLYSFRPMRTVRKGLAGNMFIRSFLFGKSNMAARGLVVEKEFICDTGRNRTRMRYDPDVSVSCRISPFIVPYLRSAWLKAFEAGSRAPRLNDPGNPSRAAVPAALTVLLVFGGTFLPGTMYRGMLYGYFALVLLESVSYFSARLAIPVAAGIVADHLVRAVAFPAGVIAGFLEKNGAARTVIPAAGDESRPR